MSEQNNNIVDVNNIKYKNKGGRPKKTDKYFKERDEITKKLLLILGITETNNMFYIEDFDNNEEKQNNILELKEDTRKYFLSGKWTIFTKKDIPRPWLSFAKSILKASKYKLKGFCLNEHSNKKYTKHGFILEKE
jgi:hypothetical protein